MDLVMWLIAIGILLVEAVVFFLIGRSFNPVIKKLDETTARMEAHTAKVEESNRQARKELGLPEEV